MKFIGLDLAGKEENDTGFCVLEDSRVETRLLHTDSEILEKVKNEDPDVIGIDAPFDFPQENKTYRTSDFQLKERGFEPLSPNFPGMRVLVLRAKEILKELQDYDVIEVFPRATEKILSVKPSKNANEDEFDALLCALTARNYWKDEYENLDGIIIPKE